MISTKGYRGSQLEGRSNHWIGKGLGGWGSRSVFDLILINLPASVTSLFLLWLFFTTFFCHSTLCLGGTNILLYFPSYIVKKFSHNHHIYTKIPFTSPLALKAVLKLQLWLYTTRSMHFPIVLIILTYRFKSIWTIYLPLEFSLAYTSLNSKYKVNYFAKKKYTDRN